jgi:hypothetical protein
MKTASDFEKSMKESPNIKVPPERRSSISSIIFFAIASGLFILFFTAISMLSGQILSAIITVFSLFGWDPIVTTLFMAMFGLFIAVAIFVLARRGNEAVTKIESGLNMMFKNPPTRFYDLSTIPPESIIHELVGNNNPRSSDNGRGCKLVPHPDNKGFDISCDEIPVTKGMKALMDGKLNSIDTKQKSLMFGVFAVFGVVIGFITVMGMMTSFALFVVWGIYLVSFFYVLVEARIIKLWGVVLSWLAFNVFFSFFVTDLVFLWTVWGAWVCGFVAITIAYLLSKDACIKKHSEYCEFL